MRQASVNGVVVGMIMVLVAAAPRPSSGKTIELRIQETLKELDVQARARECRDLPLAELEKRRGELLGRANKRFEILNKMEAEMQRAVAERRAPKPGLLQPEATVTGMRSRDYHALPPYLKRLTDEYEDNIGRNFISFGEHVVGFLVGAVSWNMTAPEGLAWAHYNSQAVRTAYYISLVLRDITAVDRCIAERTTPALSPIPGLPRPQGAPVPPFAPPPDRAMGDARLELVEVKPGAPYAYWTAVGPGQITQYAAKYYSAEYTWSAPPERIGDEGFTITLKVTAKAERPNSHTCGIFVKSPGFDIEAPAGIEVRSDGPLATKSLTVKVKPQKTYTTGSVVEFWVSAMWGPSVTYKYRVIR